MADLLERSAQKDSECALLGGLGTACFVLYQHISVRQELPYMTALNVALQLNAATATMLTRQPVLTSLDRHPKWGHAIHSLCDMPWLIERMAKVKASYLRPSALLRYTLQCWQKIQLVELDTDK